MDWTAFWYYCGWGVACTLPIMLGVTAACQLCVAYDKEVDIKLRQRRGDPSVIYETLALRRAYKSFVATGVIAFVLTCGLAGAAVYSTGPHHDQKPLAGVAATQVEGGK